MKNPSFDALVLGIAAGLQCRVPAGRMAPSCVYLSPAVLEPAALARLMISAQVAAPGNVWVSDCVSDLCQRLDCVLPEVVIGDDKRLDACVPVREVLADFSMEGAMRSLATTTTSLVRKHFTVGGCPEVGQDYLVLRKADDDMGFQLAAKIYGSHADVLSRICELLCREAFQSKALVFVYSEAALAA